MWHSDPQSLSNPTQTQTDKKTSSLTEIHMIDIPSFNMIETGVVHYIPSISLKFRNRKPLETDYVSYPTFLVFNLSLSSYYLNISCLSALTPILKVFYVRIVRTLSRSKIRNARLAHLDDAQL